MKGTELIGQKRKLHLDNIITINFVGLLKKKSTVKFKGAFFRKINKDNYPIISSRKVFLQDLNEPPDREDFEKFLKKQKVPYKKV